MMQPLRSNRRPSCSDAFTLVELLVVVSIIVLLIAILLPSLSKARRAAREVICATQLHQLGLALSIYDNEYKRLPLHVNEMVPVGNTGGREPHKIKGNGFDGRKQYTPYLPIEMLLCPLIDNQGWTPSKSNSGSIYIQYELAAGCWGDVVDNKFVDRNDPWVSLDEQYSYNGNPLNVLAADVMRYIVGGIAQGSNQVNHGFGLDDFYRYEPAGNYTVQSWNYATTDVRGKYSMNTLFADGSVNSTATDPLDNDRFGMPDYSSSFRRWMVNRP